ncbi:hypothetical protein BGZ80_006636, partial [Entomortierella chlamydospora]
PFSGILGMLSLLRDSSGLSSEQFEFVDMAKASCEMLIRIVDDLLNFSKLEADKVTLEYIPLCFEEIIGDVCDLLVPLASRKGLELIILFDMTMPLLLIGDPDRIKQILMNLIGNAIKFSTSGNVVIECRHEVRKRKDIIRARKEKFSQDALRTLASGKIPATEGSDIEIDDSKLGDEVTLYCAVKDQGIGMSPEEQKMLFVSFQQTDNGTTRKYGGTGLGLSICAQLIEHMHGKITVDSKKGEGSTFTFSAKLRTETAYDEEQNPAESFRIRECIRILAARLDMILGKKVLVLSPNKQLRQQVVLSLHGAICTEFDSMEAALASGVILMTADSTTDPVDGMDVDGDDINPQDGDASAHDGAFNRESMTQFDFIVVDHVLDSEEIDRIYPSPLIGFVLLLAPTTETLRWILPPATKLNQEPEEYESGQVDIGGRGRVPITKEAVEAAEKLATGRVQRTSERDGASDNCISRNTRKVPSQLFKKRKSRGYITVTRPVPRVIRKHYDGDKGALETSTFLVCRLIKPVRRMKILQIFYNAVNMYNNGGQMPASGWESGSSTYDWQSDHDRRSNISGYDEDELADRQPHVLASEPSSPTSPSLFVPMSSQSSPSSSPCPQPMLPLPPCLSPSVSSLKRRRDHAMQNTPHANHDTCSCNGSNCKCSGCVDLKRRSKATRRSSAGASVATLGSDHTSTAASIASPSLHPISPLSISLDSTVESDPPRNLGLSGAAMGSGSSCSQDSNANMPKRARNNDALTLLLTAKELDSCRGKNVLVAEDDFVSQKILE